VPPHARGLVSLSLASSWNHARSTWGSTWDQTAPPYRADRTAVSITDPTVSPAPTPAAAPAAAALTAAASAAAPEAVVGKVAARRRRRGAVRAQRHRGSGLLTHRLTCLTRLTIRLTRLSHRLTWLTVRIAHLQTDLLL
jgi:hypothetical protein